MGFFTFSRKNKVKASTAPTPTPQQQSASFFEPPNVFVPRERLSCDHAPPRKPPRPTVGGVKDRDKKLQRSGHAYQHGNASTPHLSRPPAGYLMGPGEDHTQQRQHYCGPVIVNQNYYFNGQQQQQQHNHNYSTQNLHHQGPYSRPGGKFSGSMGNLARDFGAVPNCSDGLSAWYGYSANLINSTVDACDDLSHKLNHLFTMIDGENLKGNEMDLFSYRHPVAMQEPHPPVENMPLSKSGKKPTKGKRSEKDDRSKNQAADVATSVVRGNYFSKVELYANSRVPKDLAPFVVYMPTWPLLCLAAQYSLAVYERPAGAERESHVSADWRTGSKAMCIKSVPMDSMHTIVFAIRGTASFMDWAVNLKAAPTAPTSFLDDPGNLCHAGFLTVARRMVKPVAARLRQLLEEDPARSRYSLMITGHSAGGAVAALLYSHMLAVTKEAKSELNILTGSFKRVHCVTFGTPPISLLPITKPNRPELKNSVFLSFINEGDPVTRADKAYVLSLLELLASPVPETKSKRSSSPSKKEKEKDKDRDKKSRSRSKHRSKPIKPVWPIPECTLSNAGRIVVLRSGRRADAGAPKDRMTVRERLEEGVIGNVCREDQLRGVVWGDPVAHLMRLYAGRVEALAVEAVTASRHS